MLFFSSIAYFCQSANVGMKISITAIGWRIEHKHITCFELGVGVLHIELWKKLANISET